MAEVFKIFIAPKTGTSLFEVEEVLAIPGKGLKGDRYASSKGHWKNDDRCEVTLIAQEALENISEVSGLDVSDGQHRRNIVTSGIDLSTLEGERFSIGEAEFIYDCPRPPCGYIASLTSRKMTKALWGKSGICVKVIKEGAVKAGSPIKIF